MKGFFCFMLVMFFALLGTAFAQEATAVVSQTDVYTQVITFLSTKFAWFPTLLAWLGGIVVVATIVDRIVPDKYDFGFMSKVVNIPVIGHLVLLLIKFSPFNFTSDVPLQDPKKK